MSAPNDSLSECTMPGIPLLSGIACRAGVSGSVRGLRWLGLALVLSLLSACQSTPVREQLSGPGEGTMAEAIQYSNRDFLSLLEKYASGTGQLDYGRWLEQPQDLQRLERQVRMIARISPDTDPQQFPTRESERSYWINTYNTLVIHAVLRYWPLDSVRDVKLSFSSHIIPGKGFFYDQPVVVGGETTNLYDLEKKILRSQKDPRLHFALNCASSSCPVLQPWEWNNEQLDQAARDFINDERNVQVKDQELWLSRIFKWYRKDFGEDLLAYLKQYALPDLNAELAGLGAKKYSLRYFDYDWDLNAQSAAEAASH